MSSFDAIDAVIARRLEHNLEELRQLIAHPSVSAEGQGMEA